MERYFILTKRKALHLISDINLSGIVYSEYLFRDELIQRFRNSLKVINSLRHDQSGMTRLTPGSKTYCSVNVKAVRHCGL